MQTVYMFFGIILAMVCATYAGKIKSPCMVDGKEVPHMTKWPNPESDCSPNNWCRCIDGKVYCTTKDCKTCSDKRIYEQGNKDPCTECNCDKGLLYCLVIDCDPSCVGVPEKGECCPVCS